MAETKYQGKEGYELARACHNRDLRLVALQRQMARWFKAAYQGYASIEKLYEKGKQLETKINLELYPNFDLPQAYADLRQALDFIDGLHDESARKYNSEHIEEVYYHMRRLL